MISHKYKCIFIHIPKCAGTSVESALGHFHGDEKRWFQDHRTIRMYQDDIINLDVIKSRDNIFEVLRRFKFLYISKQPNPNNLLTVTSKEYQEYLKFTIVRNPYRRTISWYENVMRDPITLSSYGLNEKISFIEFIKKFLGTKQLKSQLYWIKDFRGDVAVDKIIKFENLEEDFEKLVKENFINNDIELPHKLKGKETKLDDYYDEESKLLVYQAYKEELQLFDYKYE